MQFIIKDFKNKNEELNCGTYVFKNEDHTLGNFLRYSLNGHPECEFAAYSIVHPSENLMNVRVQSTGKDANMVMLESFGNMKYMIDTLSRKVNAIKSNL